MATEDLFKPVFTDDGRAAVAAAHGQGIAAKITAIAIGATGWASRDEAGLPTPQAVAADALDNEILRVPVAAGGTITPSQVLVVGTVPAASPPDSPEFWVREIGLILDDGTLLAVTSHDTLNIGYRGSLAPWIFRFVLAWSDMPAESIEVVFDGDAALASMALHGTQLEAQIRTMVQGTGRVYDRANTSQVNDAIIDLAGGVLAAVRKPAITGPAAGANSVGETPTITSTPYYSLYGLAHAATEVELATDVDFDTSIYASGTLGAVVSHAIPSETLETDTTYFVRTRHQDLEGTWSAWSQPSGFATGATFISIAQPNPLSPENGATDVVLVPTLQSFPFAVDGGGDDTHYSSEWQIDVAAGDFSAPFWTSGVTTEALTSIVASAASLSADTTYKWRVRHRGAAYGWSAWSPPASFTTKVPAGTFVADTPGSGSWTVPAGVYSIRVKTIGGGAGGGHRSPVGDPAGGGGGGGGAIGTFPVFPGTVFDYVVGSPGAHSVNWEDRLGSPGGTTSFGEIMSATGGEPGLGADLGAGGPGGTGIGGDVNGTGGNGGSSGSAGLHATDIGGGGGGGGKISLEPGFPGGNGADIGSDGGGDAGGPLTYPQAPGGGGCGGGDNSVTGQDGARGELQIEWGPGI